MIKWVLGMDLYILSFDRFRRIQEWGYRFVWWGMEDIYLLGVIFVSFKI